MQPDFNELIEHAQLAGASGAQIIPASAIVVEPQLANVCEDPRCTNYGLSMSCPPNVAGPEGFLELQNESSYGLVIRIDVPREILFSNERREVMRLLHEIVAGTEKKAVALGYKNSQGFAGGSCKNLFCEKHSDCRVLSGKGDCRHPDGARPSMSGHGINVGEMMQAASWSDKTIDMDGSSTAGDMSWVSGLVMIG